MSKNVLDVKTIQKVFLRNLFKITNIENIERMKGKNATDQIDSVIETFTKELEEEIQQPVTDNEQKES